MNLDHDPFQVSKLSEDTKKKVFTEYWRIFFPKFKRRRKKKSSPKNEAFFSRNLREDEKRSSPKNEEFFSRNHVKTTKRVLTSPSAQMQTTAKTRAGHLRHNNCAASLHRNYFTCDSACAAIIFKRLHWRLRRKYFSNFERNRASAI